MQIPIKQIEQETQVAIDRADSNANPEWKREAEAALAILIKQGNDFTADDVHRLLEQTNVKTHNNSALGGIFRNAAKDCLIVPTGVFRKSIRRETHRRPLQIWRPVTYKKRWSLR